MQLTRIVVKCWKILYKDDTLAVIFKSGGMSSSTLCIYKRCFHSAVSNRIFVGKCMYEEEETPSIDYLKKEAINLNYYKRGPKTPQLCGQVIRLLSEVATVCVQNDRDRVLHSQEIIAKVAEDILTGHEIHKSIVNPRMGLEPAEVRSTMLDNQTSLLKGDYLLGRSFTELANIRNHKLIEMMGWAVRDMVEGEFVGSRDRHNNPLPLKTHHTSAISDWTERNMLSTGSLLSRLCQATLLLAGRGTNTQNLGQRFGQNFALAWQACLDLDPFTGNQYVPGAMFRLTSAPVMLHLEREPSLLTEIDKGIESVEDVDYNKIHKLVSEGPGVTLTKQLLREHSQQAVQELQCFPDSDARTALFNIIRAMDKH